MAINDWPANDEHDGREGEEPPFAHDTGHDAEPFDLGDHSEPLDTSRLAFDEDERLPWLESPEDDDEAGGVNGARALGVLIAGLVLLAALVGGIWWATHRHSDELVADGGVIKAPAQPYKEAPKSAGGKTYAGTGDTAFVVAEGKSRPVKLAPDKAPPPTPQPSASASGKASSPAAPPQDMSGVGVQIAAYSNRAAAEAGWTRLSQGNDVLTGAKHRVVEGQADIGTVYRLQVIAPDAAAAHTLCNKLRDKGMACQVKG